MQMQIGGGGMMMQQPMPIVQQPAQPQVTVINTGGGQQKKQSQGGNKGFYETANLEEEMAKIQPHELNAAGKKHAADRLRGIIAAENNKFSVVKAKHDADVWAANSMLKQLEPGGCCVIC